MAKVGDYLEAADPEKGRWFVAQVKESTPTRLLYEFCGYDGLAEVALVNGKVCVAGVRLASTPADQERLQAHIQRYHSKGKRPMSTGDIDQVTMAAITLSKRVMKSPKPYGEVTGLTRAHLSQRLPCKPWTIVHDELFQRSEYSGGELVQETHKGSLDQKGRTTGFGIYQQDSKQARLRYEGESRADKFHGQGRLTKWPDKDKPSVKETYNGEWKYGKSHGHGELTYPNGTRHAGNFKIGQISGFGDRHYPEGSDCKRRRGYFAPLRLPCSRPGRRRKTEPESALHDEDVVQTGLGEVWFANGDCGAGVFKQHDLDGPGEYLYGPGNGVLACFAGDLAGGVSHGKGQLLYRNGDQYTGDFAEDDLHGVGILRRADGRVFCGRFLEGAQVCGTLRHPDGSLELVTFEPAIEAFKDPLPATSAPMSHSSGLPDDAEAAAAAAADQEEAAKAAADRGRAAAADARAGGGGAGPPPVAAVPPPPRRRRQEDAGDPAEVRAVLPRLVGPGGEAGEEQVGERPASVDAAAAARAAPEEAGGAGQVDIPAAAAVAAGNLPGRPAPPAAGTGEAVDLTGDDDSDDEAVGKDAASLPPPARPPSVVKGERAEAPPAASGAPSGADGWSTDEVCALLAECGFDPAGARAAGTDGGALVEMLSCGVGRGVLCLPASEGGLGLTPAQEFRLRSALRARGVVLPRLE